MCCSLQVELVKSTGSRVCAASACVLNPGTQQCEILLASDPKATGLGEGRKVLWGPAQEETLGGWVAFFGTGNVDVSLSVCGERSFHLGFLLCACPFSWLTPALGPLQVLGNWPGSTLGSACCSLCLFLIVTAWLSIQMRRPRAA